MSRGNVTEIRPAPRANLHENGPMNVLNEVGCTLEQASGILLLAIDTLHSQEGSDANVISALYGARALLDRAFERCGDAR